MGRGWELMVILQEISDGGPFDHTALIEEPQRPRG